MPMQIRVQEFEKLLEEKDNACLRGLNRGYSKSQGANGWDTASPQGKVPDNMFKLPGLREVSQPST